MNYKLETLNVLKTIVKTYPNQLLSAHLSIALSDFPNFDSISDKELYFIFERYRCEKELDILPASDSEIDELYKDSFSIEDEDLFDEDDY